MSRARRPEFMGKRKDFLTNLSSVCLLMLSFALSAPAQDAGNVSKTASLTVRTGLPLHVIMTHKLNYRLNDPVRAEVIEPVYAFDREVIPQGSIVTGGIIGFQRPSRWIRAWSLMSGNLTPLREPTIEFDTLALNDNKTFSISTDVTPGMDNVVRFTEPGPAPKGKVATAKEMARAQIEARKRAIIEAVKAPGRLDRIKNYLWSFSPYRPQSLPSGTRFTATLRSPIQFGVAVLSAAELEEVDSPPSTDIASALLTTSLNSHTAANGMTVEATLSRPVFSIDNHLMLPEGSRLSGTVVQAQSARYWHRNGKLSFMFTSIEAPASDLLPAPGDHHIEGRLDGVGVDVQSTNVKLDAEGNITAENSKTRFIAPAVAALLAIRSTEGRDAEPDNDADDVALKPGETIRATNSFGARILAGGIGFGLIGAAIGRLSQPVATVIGFYGTGRLAYSNLVGRGQEIAFPKNTPLEVRFYSPTSTK